MFRKAQLRLFAIITGILILVFTAVLIAVNVITKNVSQRQSMKVLKEIAQGVEYDDNTSTFTFSRDKKQQHHDDEPPYKPTGEPGNDEPFGKDDPNRGTDGTTKDEKKSESTTKEKTTDGTTGQNKTQPAQQPDTQDDTASPETSQQQTPQTESPQSQAQPQETPTEAPKTNAPSQQVTEAPKTQTQPQTTAPQQPVTTAPPDKPQNEQPTKPWENDDWRDPYDDREPDDYPFGPHYWDDFIYDYYSNEPDDCEQQYYDYYRGSVSDAPEETTADPAADESVYDNSADALETDLSSSLYDGSIVQLGNTSTTEPKPTEPPSSVFDDMRPTDNEVPKSLGSIDFFIVMADENGKYLSQLNNDDLDQSVAQNYINAILDEKATSGMVNNYQFYRLGKDNGTLMVFTDKTSEMAMLKQLLRTTVIIGIISLIILSAVAYFISLKIMHPLKIAFNKQKQFISDASHELKTPLTVISANADVLSGEIGENKWLTYIKSQTDRMNLLVNELLNLTRLENNTSQFERTDFDLSKAINNTALPFECKAFESNKKLELNIEEGMTVNGSERHIKQMAAIFIDNAIKYSNDGGKIIVTLKKVGDKKMFSVYNTGNGIKEAERDKIFERFYRSDDSRTHQAEGGYGLGLPIAKSIIDKHKFKLTVDNHEGQSICFIVTMP